MRTAEAQALPKSPLGRAITYAQNQWPALQRYVDNGRLSISNDAAERALRCSPQEKSVRKPDARVVTPL